MPTTRSKQLRNRRKTKTAQAPAAAGQGIAQGLGRGLKSVGRLMGLGAAAPHKPMSRAEAEELGRVFDYPLGEGYQTPLFPLEGRPKHFTTGAGGAMFDVPQERSRKPAAQPAGQFVPGVAPGAQRFISDLSPQGGSMGFDLSGLGGGAQQQLDLTPAAAMAGRVAQGVGSFLQSPGGKLATGRYQPPAGAAPAPAAAPATMMGPNGMTAVPGSNGGYNVRGPNGETYGLRDLR
ncbi:MAG: hypothetical protein OER86_08825, partial [Phycisphaerae bacterium]|nr:hypothetical protein [Phycisphaerae bacterium]